MQRIKIADAGKGVLTSEGAEVTEQVQDGNITDGELLLEPPPTSELQKESKDGNPDYTVTVSPAQARIGTPSPPTGMGEGKGP